MACGTLAAAALMRLTTKIMEGSNKGTFYPLKDVQTNTEFKVIPDDKHVQNGDCVSVEAGRTTNLRHVSQEQCKPLINFLIEAKLATSSMKGAQQCDEAKQSLLIAHCSLLVAKSEDLDAAVKEVKVLCQH